MNLAWTVEFARASEHDLSLIFDHLFETYKDLGETEDEAFDHAAERVSGIRDSAVGLGKNTYRGTKREAYSSNVRNITINKVIIWFQLDETRETVRILAFFFGGQDHIRQMLRRLLEK